MYGGAEVLSPNVFPFAVFLLTFQPDAIDLMKSATGATGPNFIGENLGKVRGKKNVDEPSQSGLKLTQLSCFLRTREVSCDKTWNECTSAR